MIIRTGVGLQSGGHSRVIEGEAAILPLSWFSSFLGH